MNSNYECGLCDKKNISFQSCDICDKILCSKCVGFSNNYVMICNLCYYKQCIICKKLYDKDEFENNTCEKCVDINLKIIQDKLNEKHLTKNIKSLLM